MKKIGFICLLFVCTVQYGWSKSITLPRDTTKRLGEQQAQARDTEAVLEEYTATNEAKTPLRYRSKFKKSKPNYGKKQRKYSPKGNFIELDPLMIGIAFAVGIGFLLLLWFLFRKISSLTFGWMFLLAIGFAMALFFWALAKSEGVDEVAWYEYFVKFGIFAGIGLSLILGGLIAMFGGLPNMLTFFWIGLILGGIALIFSIIFNNSVLNEIFPHWFR